MSYREIPLDKIRLGMYIRLPLSWWKHPFARNTFLVQSPRDLKIIRGLGLQTIEYDPEKTLTEAPFLQESRPPEQTIPTASTIPIAQEIDAEQKARIGRKRRQIQFLKQRRKDLARREQEYNAAFSQVSQIMKAIVSDPEPSMASAQVLLNNVVDTMLRDEESMVHLINLKERDAIAYFHSLNVCILSLILGKKLGLSEAELKELGLGTLFHDIGKQKIPPKILLKTTPLTKAEEKYLQLHPRYGLSLLAGNQNVSPKALQIIYQHHEKCDGKGYPQGLTEHQISYFAKITSVVNVYDNITNQQVKGRSFTPHEALSFMYTQLQREFSGEIVSSFIKSLGVYPPGTLVELSDKSLGMVITTDHLQSMRPTVILYDESAPRDEPFIINLAEEDEVNIVRCLRSSEVSPEVVSYLQPGRMVGFFVGSLASSQKNPQKIF
jgi:HD-GYP domain-containing protein (c-di-GMP phosphodiesterase class II)